MINFARSQAWATIVIVSFVGSEHSDEPNNPLPALKPAATASNAVDAFITASTQPTRKPVLPENYDAVMDHLAKSFKILQPHLSKSSQNALDAFINFAVTAKAHDIASRKRFGVKLDNVQDYMPAAGLVLQMAGTSTLLAQPPEGKTQIVTITKKSANESVFKLRWQVGEGEVSTEMNETLVAINETAGWKILVPTRHVPFGFDGITDRKLVTAEDWDADKATKSNESIIQTLKTMTTKVKLLTADVEAGKYLSAEKYVQAMYSVPLKGK